jgi:hypothetical protein
MAKNSTSALPKRYENMAAAEDDILASIAKHQKAKPSETLRLTAMGYKFGVFIDLIGKLGQTDGIDPSRLAVTAYLPEAEFVRNWPAPNNRAAQTFDDDAETIVRAREKLDEDFAGITYVPYWHHPMFCGWIIDESDFFFGFVTWDDDEDAQSFRIAANPCYHVTSTEGIFGDLRNWMTNRRQVFDLWAEVGAPEKLR